MGSQKATTSNFFKTKTISENVLNEYEVRLTALHVALSFRQVNSPFGKLHGIVIPQDE